jgi:hypothetical protein
MGCTTPAYAYTPVRSLLKTCLMAPGHAHHRRRRGSHATTSHEPSVDPALVENLELEARPAVHRRAQSLPPPTVFASQQDISQQFAAEEGFPFDFLYKPHVRYIV